LAIFEMASSNMLDASPALLIFMLNPFCSACSILYPKDCSSFPIRS
jgi:hypothetical protein